MTLLRPVSIQSITSIPWMSSKTLAHAMRDVSLRGPNTKEIWDQLQSRGDMIAHSFSAKHAALVLLALSRICTDDSKFVNDVFVTRFVRRYVLPTVWTECNSLDMAQVLHSLVSFPYCWSMLVDMLGTDPLFLKERISEMDANSLSMTSRALSRIQPDSEFVGVILQRANSLENITDRLVGQVLQLVAIHPRNSAKFALEIDSLCVPLADRLDSMSVRSLGLIASSLARIAPYTPLRFLSDFMAMLVPLLEDPTNAAIQEGASLKQLAVILRAVQKLLPGRTNFPVLMLAIKKRAIDDADIDTLLLLAGCEDKFCQMTLNRPDLAVDHFFILLNIVLKTKTTTMFPSLREWALRNPLTPAQLEAVMTRTIH